MPDTLHALRLIKPVGTVPLGMSGCRHSFDYHFHDVHHKLFDMAIKTLIRRVEESSLTV